MAKTGLNEVTTAQTFQTWLDRTNELVDIIATDALTASVLGDTTSGNATLIGSFTANTIVAVDTLKTDLLSPKDGSTSISVSSPVTINSTSQTTQTLISASGPRSLYSSGSLIWSAGFENTTSNRFIINTGTGTVKLALSSTGDLSVAGSIIGNVIGNVTGNVIGDLYQPDGVTKVFENGSAGVPAQFTGNVLGTVSLLTNHTTDALTEGSNNLYFTNARSRNSISAGTGVTYNPSQGIIFIGQEVNTNSDVNFASVETTGDVTASGDVTATSFIGDGSQLSGIKAPLVKGFITFNGATGLVIANDGLTLVKTATGSYTINIDASIRKGNSSYGVVIGNVDDKRTSVIATVETAVNQLSNYNAWLDTRSTDSFNIKATRNTNSYTHFGGNDNNTGSLFGISLVDPDYINVLLVY